MSVFQCHVCVSLANLTKILKPQTPEGQEHLLTSLRHCADNKLMDPI